MRIIQLMTTISYGDAVSNHALAIDSLLREMSVETGIYAENIGKGIDRKIATYVYNMPKTKPCDIIIYHAAIATPLNYKLPQLKGRKIMIYHNITPPVFFRGYSPDLERNCADGLAQMRYLADKVDYCIADSEFNKNDLIRMGFCCPIDVCPLLIKFNDYDTPPLSSVVEKYSNDNMKNLLFVGRIAPNKKQENVIRAFYFYQKFFNQNSRLFLVGSGDGPYLNRLIDYTEELGISERVIFTGHISFREILTYYHIADVFVCMSEHEGFCVPLVEAMYFDVPIIAYKTTAIPYTMGNSGVLLDDNDPACAAEAIHAVVEDQAYRNQILTAQRMQLQEFDRNAVAERFRKLVFSQSDKVGEIS